MGEHIDQFEDKVEKLFNHTSSNYDEFIGNMMIHISNLLIREITIPENPAVLDVACGTGITTIELAKKCNGQGTFYGIDLSQSMLEKAEQNSSELGLSNTHFMKMDAQNLKFPDSMFNIVICSMSFQFFPDQKKAIREMHRVLKPGGIVAILLPGNKSGQENLEIVRTVAMRHPEYPMFIDIVDRFNEGFLTLEEFTELFDLVGFRDSLVYGRQMISFVDVERTLHDTNAFWGVWRSGLPSEAVEGIRGELTEEMNGLSEDRGFKRTSHLLIGVGTKPS
jgi:ubiquinone/menaquinone biosynthesis C-methylase UbiE